MNAAQQTDWAWWASRNGDHFGVGPCASKQDAIEEALAQGEYDEIEVAGKWQRQVFYAECRGLHFECDECGIVPEACQECRDHLYPEESAGKFAATRNEGFVLTGYDDEEPQ